MLLPAAERFSKNLFLAEKLSTMFSTAVEKSSENGAGTLFITYHPQVFHRHLWISYRQQIAGEHMF